MLHEHRSPSEILDFHSTTANCLQSAECSFQTWRDQNRSSEILLTILSIRFGEHPLSLAASYLFEPFVVFRLTIFPSHSCRPWPTHQYPVHLFRKSHIQMKSSVELFIKSNSTDQFQLIVCISPEPFTVQYKVIHLDQIMEMSVHTCVSVCMCRVA